MDDNLNNEYTQVTGETAAEAAETTAEETATAPDAPDTDENTAAPADSTAAPAEEKASEEQKGKKAPMSLGSAFFEATSVIVTAIAIIAIVFTFCFRLVGVNGPSMQDTLQDGDWLIVTPYYSEPAYGDIVISTQETAAEKTLVKRVIAVAGDVVEVDENDRVMVNGQYLDEASYVRNDGMEYRHGNLEYPVTVPEGTVMLMGDHRSVSWDSRYSEIGFIDVDSLLGKVRVRLSKDWNVYKNFNG